ncbi:MAG: hypothetical protein AAFX93_09595 [Verrucomicrobiota bacterium]
MPDWFYRTVSRDVLFQFEPKTARDLALNFMGGLARLPLGPQVIELMGHMHPHASLERQLGGKSVQSPLGLGYQLDPEGTAFQAWTQFGFGLIEVGPLGQANDTSPRIGRDPDKHSISLSDSARVSIDQLIKRVKRCPNDSLATIARYHPNEVESDSETLARNLIELLSQMSDSIDFIAIECTNWDNWDNNSWEIFHDIIDDTTVDRLLIVVRNEAEAASIASKRVNKLNPWAGILVDGTHVLNGTRVAGPECLPATLATIRKLRLEIGESVSIIASGGIHQPADARSCLDAGAQFVMVDSGLVFSGPGLPKRINESIFSTHKADQPALEADRAPRYSWFWTGCLGIAMLLGSVIALWLAATSVVLPYDLEFCGWNPSDFNAFNPQLLPFMSHDRVTLAGVMISIGVLFCGLSWFGSRRGTCWARTAILTAAGVGFLSFFLFLGFGYFDPFHGFVTAILFQLFALGLYAQMPASSYPQHTDWRESRPWRLGQWGQLLQVVHSVGLLLAGIIISIVGIGDVFVSTDLEFLGQTRDEIQAANKNLIPLVAHDRATLGGMLISAGLAYLLTSLWGINRGQRWLWWTLLLSGLPAYIGALAIHYIVGYNALFHLLPAYLGLILFVVSLALLKPWMSAQTSVKA